MEAWGTRQDVMVCGCYDLMLVALQRGGDDGSHQRIDKDDNPSMVVEGGIQANDYVDK